MIVAIFTIGMNRAIFTIGMKVTIFTIGMIVAIFTIGMNVAIFTVGMNVAIFPERFYFQSVHIHWNVVSEMSCKGCYTNVQKSRATTFCTLAPNICLFLIMECAGYHTCDA
jgi:hypothetical protein